MGVAAVFYDLLLLCKTGKFGQEEKKGVQVQKPPTLYLPVFLYSYGGQPCPWGV